MMTFFEFLAESGHGIVLFGHHPAHGIKSVRVADIPENQSTAHEKWFERMGWPHSGPDYDKIPRGEAIISPGHVHVKMSSSHKFASNEIISHLKTKYHLDQHEIREAVVRA